MARTGVGLASVHAAAGALACLVACNTPDSTDFYERFSSIELGGMGGSAGSRSPNAGTAGGTDLGGQGGETNEAGQAGNHPTAGRGGSSAGSSGAAGSGGSAGARAGTGGEADAGSDGEAGSGGAPDGCAAITPGAVEFDGHCYALRTTPREWPEARRDCEEQGGHLVTITSQGRTRAEFQAENAFVWQLTGELPSWIGATDGKQPNQAGDGTYYTWSDGEAMTFDNWSDGNPNNSSGACQDSLPCSCDQGACYEHCGFQWMNPGKDGSMPGWNDRLCDHVLPYVCEWP